MRYRGQSYELTVPAPFSPEDYEDVAAIQKAFFRAYEQAYGIPHDAATEIVTLRVRVTQRVPRRPMTGGVARAETEVASGTGGRPAPGGRRGRTSRSSAGSPRWTSSTESGWRWGTR